MRTDTQTNSLAFRRDQQCSQQVETLVMLDGRPLDRCLATPRPGPFERRNKRKTAFIFQNEGSAQLATLFLSSAVPLSSLDRSLPHPDKTVGAGVVGYSNPSAASHTRPRWSHSAHQTTARSPGRSDPVSSSRPHIRRHRLLCLVPLPSVSPASPTASSDDRVDEWLFSSLDAWHPAPAVHGASGDTQDLSYFFWFLAFCQPCQAAGSDFG